MPLNIRGRYEQVSVWLGQNKALREIAKLLNIPKTSIERHLNRAKRQDRYPDSAFWRTPEGQAYLRLMVISIIYYPGKHQSGTGHGINKLVAPLG